jgi:hypothetical protein
MPNTDDAIRGLLVILWEFFFGGLDQHERRVR